MHVDDYVRTKKGEIGKISYISVYNTAITTDYYENPNITKIVGVSKIAKTSPNILDLIEVGDYVNGRYVDKYQGKLGTFYELPNGKWKFIELSNEHYLISSIVTKEQFSSMEYKVESEVE